MKIALDVDIEDVAEARSNQKEDSLMSRAAFIDVGGHEREILGSRKKPGLSRRICRLIRYL